MRDPDDYQIDNDRTKNNFNAAAHDYDGVAVVQREVGLRLLDRLDLISKLPDRILDLGSGTGVCGRLLQKRYRKARIVQMDFALQMLKLAAGKSRRPFSRQSFVCGAAAALPFAGTIDMTFSNLMLQWCNDPGRVFSQVHEAMTEDGLFIFSCFGPDTLSELRRSWADIDDETHINIFLDMHDIGDALVGAGFADPVMEVETLTLTYEDAWSVFRDLKRLGASNATAGRRRTLTGKGRIARVIEQYDRFRRDGRLPATFEVVYGHAWRRGNSAGSMRDGVAVVPVSKIKKRRHG